MTDFLSTGWRSCLSQKQFDHVAESHSVPWCLHCIYPLKNLKQQLLLEHGLVGQNHWYTVKIVLPEVQKVSNDCSVTAIDK